MEKRYLRHYSVSEWNDDAQNKLKNSSVLVAGAGGLGSPLLYYLASAGIGNITIVDDDIIEDSNLNRQILFNETDIGQPKAETALNKLFSLNSSINICAVHSTVEELDDEFYKKQDLLIDCLDNFETRLFLNRKSITHSIPLLHAGVSEFRGQITLTEPGKTLCLACFLDSENENFNDGIIGAAAGVIGSIQALEAIKYLALRKNYLANRILLIDLINMRFNLINAARNKNCNECS